MSSEDYKKAYLFLSNKCSKKELSSKEALVFCSKLTLNITQKHNLINELKKNKFIDHQRYANAFVHDRFSFYKWGKLKIRHHLAQKGIEENYIELALDNIDSEEYKKAGLEETTKKFKSMGSPRDYNSKQKLLKFVNLKGYETEIAYEIVELVMR